MRAIHEYQHDRVLMVFKDFCVLVNWAKVASALEGLKVTNPFLPFFCEYLRSELTTSPGLTKVKCLRSGPLDGDLLETVGD